MTGFVLPLQSSNAQSVVASPAAASVSHIHQNLFEFYTLKWRQNILWIAPKANQAIIAPASAQQIAARLKASPVRCVCINPAIGEAHLQVWTEACAQVGKKMHLRAPKGAAQPVSASKAWMTQHAFPHSLRWIKHILPEALTGFSAS